MDTHTKDYRITAAVDKDTYNIVKELGLHTFRTSSQIANTAIMQYIISENDVLKSTNREFEARVLSEKCAELVKNMRKMDVFYDFKANFWEICLNLSGKINKNNQIKTDDCGFLDFIHIIELIRVDKPALYDECVIIMKRTLNKAQRETILPC